jgi:hypothetical protein
LLRYRDVYPIATDVDPHVLGQPFPPDRGEQVRDVLLLEVREEDEPGQG